MGCASAGIEPTDNGLRAFCRFCVDSGWMEGNPASALKTTRVSHCPTLPYSDEEVDRLLEAARTMQVFGRYGPRIESMILLLRYSGLRMRVRRGNAIEERTLPVRDHFAMQMDHMSGCVMDDKQPLTPGEEGLRDLKLMMAIYEAARTGKTVKL